MKPDDQEKGLVISFSDEDYLEGFDWDHDDSMVITIIIHDYAIKKILVDQGSSVDILYSAIVTGMNITKSDLKPHNGT